MAEIVVTGASGFVGRALMSHICKLGIELAIFSWTV